MPTTPEIPQIQLAHFKTLTGSPRVEFDVHFNPESLEYSITNTVREEGNGGTKKQFVGSSTSKLTMQLVFDTTDTGEDVRSYTDMVASLLRPVPGNKQVPPNVEFSWGVYRFTGMVEQHREKLEFFAPSGVPLRATIDLGLASQDVQFESSKNPSASVDLSIGVEASVVAGVGGAFGIAASLGDPRAARAIGAMNGSASLRFGAEGGIAVGGSVDLQAEAGFSAGAGIGGGIGIGGGASAGIGGGAGVGIGAGASFGVGAGAGGGAFGGLRAGASSSASISGGQALFGASASVGAVGGAASFGIGGQAQMQSGGGVVDVGADVDVNTVLRFG